MLRSEGRILFAVVAVCLLFTVAPRGRASGQATTDQTPGAGDAVDVDDIVSGSDCASDLDFRLFRVDPRGVEPLTSWLPAKRSTS